METQPAKVPSKGRVVLYAVTVVIVAAATVGVMMLWNNIWDRKQEAKQQSFKLVELTEETIDPGEWGKNFPRQYDSYKRTVDIERTKHGGSEAFQKLDEDPRWRELFRGYGFGLDYREERGHAYMLSDQRETERVTKLPQPGACLHCHASIIPAYRKKGKEAGIPDTDAEGQVMKGFALVNKMKYADATKLVSHPVSCVDCHDPKTMALRVTRPGFLEGIRAFARSTQPLPWFPSIERWRKAGRKGQYDPNRDASRQELRSMACGQCHVEYYFKGDEKYLTYPWHNGLKMEDAEKYYDDVKFTDWTHKTSKAPMLKAQHPEFELWNQGIHARSGVSCADCHMPYKREGAIKVSDHHVRSPMLNVARACQTCHRFEEREIKARVELIQDRTKALLLRAEEAVLALIRGIIDSEKAGASPAVLTKLRDLHRKAQWRTDYIAAENSMGFHAPQEAARILAEAIDLGRQGEAEAMRWRLPASAVVPAPAAPDDQPQEKGAPTPPPRKGAL